MTGQEPCTELQEVLSEHQEMFFQLPSTGTDCPKKAAQPLSLEISNSHLDMVLEKQVLMVFLIFVNAKNNFKEKCLGRRLRFPSVSGNSALLNAAVTCLCHLSSVVTLRTG